MPEGPQLMEEERRVRESRSPDTRVLEQQGVAPLDSRRHEQVPDNRYSQSKPREYRRVSLKTEEGMGFKMVLLPMLTQNPTTFGSLVLT